LRLNVDAAEDSFGGAILVQLGGRDRLAGLVVPTDRHLGVVKLIFFVTDDEA